MPTHEVNINLHTKIVHSKDVEFEIKSDGSKLGTMLISKGNIEWVPVGNSVNKQRLSWEKFAEIMQECGRTVKI
jgi:hypothetical protein